MVRTKPFISFMRGAVLVATATLATSGFAQAKRVLTMTTSADYPPYEFHDTSTGNDQIIGFDVDIAHAIAKELNFELKIVDMDFNGLLPALQSGRADFVMAGMTPTPERTKNVDFSKLYYEARNTILAKKEKNLTKPEDLVGKKVGVQLGTIQEKEAKQMSGVNVIPLNKIGEIIQELKSRRLEAAIIEDTVARGYAAQHKDLAFSPIAPKGPNGSAIAFPKGSKNVVDFQKVLDKLKANGEIERLVKKWFEKK